MGEHTIAHDDECEMYSEACGCDSRRDLKQQRDELAKVLEEARRAIGDHSAPDDCYATGPLTGDPIRDLVQCPACSFIAMYDAALAMVRGE